MEKINHIEFAKKALSFLINHVKIFREGNKYITYGELARGIDYPLPHTGSFFGKNIGVTLGIMGHLLDDVSIESWHDRIPFLQALIVAQNTKLPSDGLKEFQKNYPSLSKEKKKDFIKLEYKKIFQFGERWFEILKILDTINVEPKKKEVKKKRYNPFGNEGSPEHRGLRDYIANNPNVLGLAFEIGVTEYPLKSGDSIDVLFSSKKEIIGVEVKSILSGNDDVERGIFQCIKYREVLKAENIIENKKKHVDCILVTESEMDKKNLSYSKKLNVKHFKINYNL